MSSDQHRSVFLLSFNRPWYLRRTLRSLRRQSVRGCRIHLFQDGPRAAHHEQDLRAVAECIAHFRHYFPDGVLVVSQDNLGIARNMLAAQRHAFRKDRLSTAYFFEDDLVLHRRYLEQLFILEETLRPVRHQIPYFAAYGDIFTRAVPRETHLTTDLCVMDHLWGFGLSGDHWEEEQAVMAAYFDYIETVPYAERDHELIRRMYLDLDVPLSITSQDGARAVALCRLGRAAIRTRSPLARYIGETGTHFTPEIYRQWGFGNHRPKYFARPIRPAIDDELANRSAAVYREGILALYPLDQHHLHAETHYHARRHRSSAQARATSTGSL